MESLDPASANSIKDLLTIMALLAGTFAGVTAGVWFLLRSQSQPGLVLDLDVQIIDAGADVDLIGELYLLMSNRGTASDKVRNLYVEVRSVGVTTGLARRYIDSQNLIRPQTPAIGIAPNTRQILATQFNVPRTERVIRISAVINARHPEIIDQGQQDLALRSAKVMGRSAQHLTLLVPVVPRPVQRDPVRLNRLQG